eukprot:915194-Pelagomonas_calceolata.AAC.7
MRKHGAQWARGGLGVGRLVWLEAHVARVCAGGGSRPPRAGAAERVRKRGGACHERCCCSCCPRCQPLLVVAAGPAGCGGAGGPAAPVAAPPAVGGLGRWHGRAKDRAACCDTVIRHAVLGWGGAAAAVC